MKTRDPDHPGAQRLSPIKPGTLCLLVQDGTLYPEVVGRTVTVSAPIRPCHCGCNRDVYPIAAEWLLGGIGLATRSVLQPILPPGIDDQVEQSVGNPQLEVV